VILPDPIILTPNQSRNAESHKVHADVFCPQLSFPFQQLRAIPKQG